MNIYLSSATVQSYENKNKNMDIFYNPILILEKENFSLDLIDDIKVFIEASELGLQEFEIQNLLLPKIKQYKDKTLLELKLAKKEMAFFYDNYLCSLKFELYMGKEKIEHKVMGLVKTKWSKGLI